MAEKSITSPILDLHRQGLSVPAIARQCNIDRKTARRYIARGLEPPAYGPRQPRVTFLEPFTGYLRGRVSAYARLSGAGWLPSAISDTVAGISIH